MKNTFTILYFCFSSIVLANINDVDRQAMLSAEDITKQFIESVKSIPYLNERAFTIVDASRDRKVGIKSAKYFENGGVLNKKIKFDCFQSTHFVFHEVDRKRTASFYVFQLQNTDSIRKDISKNKNSGSLATKASQSYRIILFEDFLCIVVMQGLEKEFNDALNEALQKLAQKK